MSCVQADRRTERRRRSHYPNFLAKVTITGDITTGGAFVRGNFVRAVMSGGFLSYIHVITLVDARDITSNTRLSLTDILLPLAYH